APPVSEPMSASEPEPAPAPVPVDTRTSVVPIPVPVPVVTGDAAPASGLNPELVQAIGLLGLPGEMQVRLVNEVQALPMSSELRTVLITAMQTLAKAEAFVPVFVYRTPAPESRKMRTEKGVANIEFALNATAIDPSLRGNRAELDKIGRTIGALEQDADLSLKSITIKGYASPEGPYAGNAVLAQRRAEAVKAYVHGLTNLPADRMTAGYEAEDWEGLKLVLEASGLPHKAAILKIVADKRLTPDAREWKIKSTYKDDYAYMRTYIYPALRHVDYVVEYEVRTYADPAEIIRLLGTQPQKLSLQELYAAAQTMEEGGTAYDEVFETAVRLFPSDEVANLNAANSAMRWRDLS
ncbi:MAG: OmpA family protein, partial [Bacteroidales bacterium]|nr:OmpA family protein [Bacteroidales bacterium]